MKDWKHLTFEQRKVIANGISHNYKLKDIAETLGFDPTSISKEVKRNRDTITIGKNCVFNSSGYTNHIGLNHRCIITTMAKDAKIIIGNGTGMSSSTVTSWKSIIIGENVRIGANCTIMDGDFHLDDSRTPPPRDIFIGNNVWLGANVVVMKGVHIGDNSIIGMNSIVTKDIPANSVAVGNPCKVIKSLQ